jgi:hypothetical protein
MDEEDDMSSPTSENKLTEEEMEERLSIIQDALYGLEDLRSRLIDVEAVSHAAADILKEVPYIPPAPPAEIGYETAAEVQGEASDVHEGGPRGGESAEAAHKHAWQRSMRLQYGRLQSLVYRTAELSFDALEEVQAQIEKLSIASYRGYGQDTAGEATAGEDRRDLYTHIENPQAQV